MLLATAWKAGEASRDMATFAIITRRAKEVLVPLPGRAPVVQEHGGDAVLNPPTSGGDVDMLLAYGVTDLHANPVTLYVDTPKNNSHRYCAVGSNQTD
jgi:putative SOS response-associated peptidase YedK